MPGPGCFTFDGDHALAYVRSRHYEYEDPPGSGDWREDPSSDLGRISRQQDFLRRSLTSILNKGLLNPSVASGLISAATGGDVVTSNELSLAKLMEFAGVLRDVQAASIPSYQIEAVGRTIGGACGARAPDPGRQHAGRAGDVPRRDVTGRRPGAVVRADHHAGDPARRAGRHDDAGHGAPGRGDVATRGLRPPGEQRRHRPPARRPVPLTSRPERHGPTVTGDSVSPPVAAR